MATNLSVANIIDLSRYESWVEAYQELLHLLSTRRNFWGNASLNLRLASYDLTPEDVADLKRVILEFDLNVLQVQTNSFAALKSLKEAGFRTAPAPARSKSGSNVSKAARLQTQSEKTLIPQDLPPFQLNGKTVVLGGSESIALRSGNQISHNGNLVIIGDINPGCEIRTTGSIIVYGKISGNIHSGFGITDDYQLSQIFIKALKMTNPLQLSIGPYSASYGTDLEAHDKLRFYPQTAVIRQNQIWLTPDFS
ncbi:MAG: septum site-determining protein MinC [Candidatus Caenarcaniphilales bacterium]|nr:septum site-determining protein MinC [Candidatus Caenarcaniphilales bacterium]